MRETGTRHKIPRMKATGQPTGHRPDPPDNQPVDRPAYMDSTEAAQALGISLDALRKRIARGTIKATKEAGHWYVQGPDNQPAADLPPTGHQPDADQDQVDGKELALAAQDARIASLESQLQAKDTQIDQLHRLLATTALPAPPTRPWWRFWR